jgi:hypothetical protein
LAQAEEPPRFGLPVDCGKDTLCVVQNYVDTAPGPDARDFTCGPLVYDKHKGVDIRVPTLLEMRAGVPVVAAAPGVVKRARDGMADISIDETGVEPLKGREAGNAVVIGHGNGWESQYAHLRKGSVAVKPGERVAAGQRLGLIGLSGKTEFPHVHFALRKNGRTIDPFTGQPPESGCGPGGGSLWSPPAQAALAYRAGGLLLAGFAEDVPSMDGLVNGEHRGESLSSDGRALVFWALAWGLREGDRETIRIVGPDGEVFAEGSFALPRDKAQWRRFTGKRRKAERWPPGRYRGEYRVTRDRNGVGLSVIEVTREIEVR